MAWSAPDEIGESSPDLPAARKHLSKFSYGAKLKGTTSTVIDADYLEAQRQFKNNVHFDVARGKRPGPDVDPTSPAFDWATKKQMGLLGPAAPPPAGVPPRVFYSFTGTWGAWNNGFGFDIGVRIDQKRYYHQPLGYNTQAFMIGNDPGHSYLDMLNDGANEFLRLALADRRPKVLSGYSGGAGAVVESLNRWPADRRDEVIAVIQTGDPNRPPGRTLLGNDPGGHGISEDFPPDWVLNRYYSFTLDGDMYPNAVGLLPIFYDILVRMEATPEFALYLFQLLVDQMGNLTPIGTQLLGLGGANVPGFGLLSSVLPMLTGTRGLGGLLGGGATSSTGAAGTPKINLLAMVMNIPAIIQSLIALLKFVMTQAHGMYGSQDPKHRIFNGLNAVDRAVQIVNALP